jgi:hypothetical protein
LSARVGYRVAAMPKFISIVALVFLLSLLYFATNPYWYGDALWYAMDISKGYLKDTDPGHLIWRPLALYLWMGFRWLSPRITPLAVFQIISGFGTALGCVATYFLARRFLLSKSSALCAAVIVAGSNFCLSYGGSGSAYGPAMGLSTLALVIALSNQSRAHKLNWLWAGICVSLAIFTWGVSALMIPTVGLALLLRSNASLPKRAVIGIFYSVVVSGLVLIGCVAGYRIAQVGGFSDSFMTWLHQSSHGIKTQLSILSFARAVLGFFASYIYLGSFGTAIKGLLTGQADLDRARLALPLCLIVILAAGIVAAKFGMLRALIRKSQGANKLAVLTCLNIILVAAFATSWQGSDIERFCLAMPLCSVAITYGLAQLKRPPSRILPVIMAAFIALSNLIFNIVPMNLSHGGLTMELGKTARQTMPEGSLLILSGQALGVSVWGPTMYFYNLQVHSILYDVQSYGPDHWQERLIERVNKTIADGKKIAILSDFIGIPSPGGIDLNLKENPVPTIADVTGLFTSWNKGQNWNVGRFTFVEISPPK